MKEFLHHFFLPGESNNHRAKLLHHNVLFLTISFFLFGLFAFQTISQHFPQVLGIAVDITSSQLLNLTNQKRQEAGLPPLVLNDELATAAKLKAENMFAKDYWSHNAPDGTTPWYFVKQSGYTYTYAGENLARGFSTSNDVVTAWMASPTHKENMLSKNYKDIGFAVMTGKLGGEETVLVVEMFGNTALPKVASNANQERTLSQSTGKQLGDQTQTLVEGITISPILNLASITRNSAVFVLMLFIGTLILDMIIVERKKIVRLVGHNRDHIFFLGAILLFVILVGRGMIV